MTYRARSIVEKITKKDLKKPDPFIHSIEALWHEVERFRQIVIAVVVIFLLGGIGYTAYNWQSNRKETAAQTAFYSGRKTLQDIKKSYELDPKAVLAAEKKNEKPPEQKKKTGNLEQDLGPAVTQLEAVLKEHSGTRAATLAALELAPVYEEYKQIDRAQTVLQTSISGLKKSELLWGLANLQLGNAQQMKGSCQEAIQTWTAVSSSKDHTFLQGEALLRQALCYEALSQKEKAVELYRKVSQDFADSDAGKSAKKYLRLISNETTYRFSSHSGFSASPTPSSHDAYDGRLL